MSENKVARKSTQVSTTVSPEVYEALREYRFDKRIEKMTDIVAAALSEYMENHDIKVKVSGAEDSGEVAAPKPGKA